MATGEFDRFARLLLDTAGGRIMRRIYFLSVEQQLKILEDFEAGRAHILMHLDIKTSVWQQLPLLLCGLGHWDPVQARSCAHRASAQWRRMTDDLRESAHAITKE
eukprot:1133087-Pyramimonas_sp.AAC.1